MRYEHVEAAGLWVEDRRRGDVLGEDEVSHEAALVLGNPSASAFVIEGSRAELAAVLREMAAALGLRAVVESPPEQLVLDGTPLVAVG